MTLVSRASDYASPSFDVWVNGQLLSDKGYIDSVTVEMEAKIGEVNSQVSSCEIGLLNWEGLLTGHIAFKQKNYVVVDMGYPTGLMRRMGVFILEKPRFEFPSDGPMRIILDCMEELASVANSTEGPFKVGGDNLEALIRNIVQDLNWSVPRKDGKVIKKAGRVAAPNFLFDVDNIPDSGPIIEQAVNGETAWTVLRRLARRFDRMMWVDFIQYDQDPNKRLGRRVDQGVFHFRQPSTLTTTQLDNIQFKHNDLELLILRYKTGPDANIKRLSLTVKDDDAFKPAQKYRSANIDADGNVRIKNSKSIITGTSAGNKYQVEPVLGQRQSIRHIQTTESEEVGDALDQAALDAKEVEGLFQFEMDVDIIGDPRMVPGTLFKVENIGPFSQFWFVTKVRHSIREGGYDTSIEAISNTSGKFEDAVASLAGHDPRANNRTQVTLTATTKLGGNSFEIVPETP